ncbi:PTS fructose transporter subunit IIA [Lactobacillus curvatus]|nr:PTS fructose transporter subunit IIA [Latilactobacillus curvatus]MSE23815.1 PTS fructose transporter subunit IIA [Latilactobacillus curvatus]
MSTLVLTSHGRFCEELKKSVELIFGPQDGIRTLALLPEEGEEDYVRKFKALQEETNGDKLIVLADLMGGTPANQVSKFVMQGANIDLYTGMNMPMCIGYLNAQMTGQSLNLVNDATQGVQYLNDMLPKNE